VPSSQALHIPSTLPFENAVVLPLALATAAAGLYPANGLNLPLPSTSSTQTKKTVLIWGGSSSVGSCAVQLAVASGIRVISTASAANHAFVRGMGADVVFDYRSDSVVNDIVEELKGRQFVGVYDAISEGPCFDAIAAVLGKVGKKVPVVTVLPVEGEIKTFGAVFGMFIFLFYFFRMFLPLATDGVTVSNMWDSHSLPDLPRAEQAYWRIPLAVFRP
jgi:NADPH:quinone reductase-like Zn-dependent oxidoreductase